MQFRISHLIMIALFSVAAIAPPMLTMTTIAEAGVGSMHYKVVRSDGTAPATDEAHEFNGGSHAFFTTMDEPSQVAGWLESLSDRDTYQQGWTRLVFDWAVPIRSIVLHRATAKNGTLKDGWLRLEVRTIKGNWVKVFERERAEVTRPVTINKPLQGIGPCTGVRFTFRAPGPMTIGPIDVDL